MLSDELVERIRSAFRAELRRKSGQIRQVEQALGRSDGYLRKVCRPGATLKLDVVLSSLEVMGVDPMLFFSNIFSAPPPPDLVLRNLDASGQLHGRFRDIERATWQSELGGPSAVPGTPVNVERLLARVETDNGREERRRLRTAARYRHPAFVRAYLERLDARRYDDPKSAGLSAHTVAVKLLPETPCEQRERLALELTAIGIYGSAFRMVGNFATAQRAVVFALEVARKHELAEVTADLLQRGASILIEHGAYAEAMMLLDEALLIYFDVGSDTGMGRILVDRGVIWEYQGKYSSAISALKRALSLLRTESPLVSRNRLAAYQVLSAAFQNRGDLERAELAVGEALLEFNSAGDLIWAKLLWRHGNIALAQHEFEAAEDRFRQALGLFESKGSSARGVVALDLSKALLGQGRFAEATEIAIGMAELLKEFGTSKVARAAISSFLRAVLAGQLSTARIEHLRKALGHLKDRGAADAMGIGRTNPGP